MHPGRGIQRQARVLGPVRRAKRGIAMSLAKSMNVPSFKTPCLLMFALSFNLDR